MGHKSKQLEAELGKIDSEKSAFVNPQNAKAIKQMAAAYSEDNLMENPPDGETTNAASTITNYAQKCRRTAYALDLQDTTLLEIKEFLQSNRDGTNERVKTGGLSNGTLRLYSLALRKFYKVHPQDGLDEEAIPVPKQESTSVDPDDMLTRDEIQELRASATNSRDLAMFDFLLYTGQRISAMVTLQIKHLDLDEGRFSLNGEAEGLKGANEHGKWRDLLLSQASIRQWLQTGHPCPNDPEAHVFTAFEGYDFSETGSQLAQSSVWDALNRMKQRTDIDKPLNPHALRHNFVTVALRRKMPESAIKHQLGHSPDSRVMESTYAHLKDSDHIKAAREAFGLEVENPDNELAPDACPRCGHNPAPQAILCQICGLSFSPDAKDTEADVKEDLHESKGETAAEGDSKAEKGVDMVKELLADPEMKAALIEELQDDDTNGSSNPGP